MPWTEKQEQVIKERDKTILVSAAAGSGKTATLVERIYQKMIDPEHPVDITSFLVVTFTKAAAAQMKEKLLSWRKHRNSIRNRSTLQSRTC